MCGIAGYCLDPKHAKTVSTADLAGQMLSDIEHRGYHATGVAYINRLNGRRVIRKAPTCATEFIKRSGQYLCDGAQTAILHTRWATQGDPKNNDNNHPIPRGRIVLTHNGHISNDTELFKQLNIQRRGQVDSEAVTALLAFSKAKPWQVLPQMRGTAALAWIEQDNANTLHLARVNSSPLWIGQTNTGSLVYGSTEETIENACVMLDSELDWKYSADEGEYFKVRDGAIIEYETFKPTRYAGNWNYRDSQWDKYWDKQDELAF